MEARVLFIKRRTVFPALASCHGVEKIANGVGLVNSSETILY